MKRLVLVLLSVLVALPVDAGVNIQSGGFTTSKFLFSTSGGPMPLRMTLNYDGLDTNDGSVGPGWSHAYDIHLHQNSDGTLVLTGGVAKRFYFPDGNGNYIPRMGDHSTLIANGDGTYTLTFTSGRVYQFGTDKKIASITNRHGDALLFDRTVADQLSVTDPAGRTAIIHSNAQGKVDWIQDPAGNQYDLTYHGTGRLFKITFPAPQTGANRPEWTYNYTAEGLLEYVTDPNRNITKYGYTDGKVTRIVSPDGVLDTNGGETADAADHSKSYSYGSSTPLSRSLHLHSGTVTQTTVTEKDGGTWVHLYDAESGDRLGKQNPLGHLSETGYYPDSSRYHGYVQYALRLIDIDDTGLQHYRLTHTLAYDNGGNPLEVKSWVRTLTVATDGTITGTFDGSVDQHITTTYGTFNRPTSITDQIRNQTTAMAYADLGNGREQVTYTAPRINAADSSGPQTVMVYRADGQVESVTDPLGRTVSYSYNASGQLTDVLDPSGIQSTLGNFDPFGRAQLRTLVGKDASSRSTQLEYDALSRLDNVTEGPAANQRITQFDYDDAGNRIAVIDAEGNETGFEHNALGQVTKITQTLNPGQPGEQLLETILGYGGAGCPSCGTGADKLTSVMDARQNALGNDKKTVFTYDILGRVTKETDPEGKIMGYVYTADGRIKEVYQGEPGTGQLLLRYLYSNDGKLLSKQDSLGTVLSSFTYTADNRLQTAATPDTSLTMTYYDNGWLKTVDNGTYQITYDYDLLGRRELMTLTQGATTLQTVDYVYDPTTKDLKDIVSSTAGTFTFATDQFDRRKTLSFPNGIVGSYSYDDANLADWLTEIDYTDGPSGPSILTIGYPLHDKVGNRMQRTEDGVATDYNYDSLYRVTQAQKGTDAENFVWDEVGNRRGGPTVKETTDNTYTHNAVNQMLQGRKRAYAYDDRGNQTHRYLNAQQTQYWQLDWTPDNKLQEAKLVEDGQILKLLQFKYDAFGRRIEKALTKGTQSLTTTYIYDGEDIVLQSENDGTSTTTTNYTHGPGIDEPLARTQNSTTHYYHADGLGSIVAITDSTKAIVQRYSYDTFGLPTATTDFRQPYQYTSREWDAELGLFYYRARYYDPIEGRFIAKDPIGLKGGWNIFAYVEGNPVNFADPFGLKRSKYNPLGGFKPKRRNKNRKAGVPPGKMDYDKIRKGLEKSGPFWGADSILSPSEPPGTAGPPGPGIYPMEGPYRYVNPTGNCSWTLMNKCMEWAPQPEECRWFPGGNYTEEDAKECREADPGEGPWILKPDTEMYCRGGYKVVPVWYCP